MLIKRAFTLIELLVVIAIIAILAAILFPVFAQAKEAAKKTQSLAQMKQMGLAVMMYAGDSDDCFPQAMADFNGFYQANDVPVPADWRPDYTSTEPYLDAENMVWANSIVPYEKTLDLLSGPGLPEFQFSSIASQYANPHKHWKDSNVIYNGLLHTLPSSEVAMPSKLPMFWEYGKIDIAGQALSNPMLWCPLQGVNCRWAPDGQTQAGVGQNDFAYWEFWGPWTYWTWGRGMNFVHVDGSAKFQTLSRPTQDVTPRYAAVDQPYSWMGVNGEAGYLAHCKQPSGFYWPCMFRPDSEFNYSGEEQLF